VAALFAIGFWASKDERSTKDFFLARRAIPWWAVCLSFVATEISAMTVVGVPATAFRENWQYAQFFIGSAAARVVIAYLFIPAFYKFDCTTIYEFLRHRFGPGTQYTASAFFFVTRLLASGVRLMAACIAVKVLMGWPLAPVIALFTVISVVYIGFGGIKAVIWTNVLQALTFIAAGLATLAFIGWSLGGEGLRAGLDAASRAGRLDLWNWGPALGEPDWLAKFARDPNIVWLAIGNGFLMSMAAFGTDQELMQRLLTVETRAGSQRSMLYSIGASFLVLMIFLSVGTGIYAWYAQHLPFPSLAKPDAIYPHFAVSVMPALLRGLVLSAIVMASIDSPLSSLTSSFVVDIYKPLVRPASDERHLMLVSRIGILVFGLLLGGLAWGFSYFDKMLWLAFKVGGVTFGSLLGVFLLGLLTTRHADRANTFAMIFMAVFNAVLLVLSEKKIIGLGWTWLIIFGTLGTYGLAWALGPVLDRTKKAS
jgi:solute:Na+ symporter, SSS family